MSSPAPGLHWSISGGLIWVWISILLLNLSNLAFFSSLLWVDINPNRTSSLLFREPSLWPHFLLMEMVPPTFFIRVQLLYNVVLVSAWSESATYIHIPILLAPLISPSRSSQSTELGSLWYTADSQWLFYTRQRTCQTQSLSSFLPYSPPF